MIEELSPWDLATRESFESFGEVCRGFGIMEQNLDRPDSADSAGIRYGLVSQPGETRTVVHGSSVNPPFTMSRDMADLLREGQEHNEGMGDRWPQRSRFKEIVDAWRHREGLTIAAIAERLDLTYNTLRQYTSPARKDTKPSVELLTRAAILFGCRLTEFVDDPNADPGGVPLGALAPLDRSKFDRMIKAVNEELVLTDEDKDILYEDYMRDAGRRDAANRKRGK